MWVHDFARRTSRGSRFGGNNTTPVWSADGRTHVLLDDRARSDASPPSLRKPVDGSRQAEAVAQTSTARVLSEAGRRGARRTAARRRCGTCSRPTSSGSASGSLAPRDRHLVSTTFDETGGSLSPDGRWLAYASDETGRYEIYVAMRAPPGGGRWQVSTAGGRRAALVARRPPALLPQRLALHGGPVTLEPAVVRGVDPDDAVRRRVRDAHGHGGHLQPRSHDTRALPDARPSVDAIKADSVRVLLNWGRSLRRATVASTGYNPASR